MSYKLVSYVFQLICVIAGILFYTSAVEFPEKIAGQVIGPGYFPKMISLILIIVSVISFITTYKKRDQHIEIKNMHLILTTIVLSVLFIFIWETFMLFYLPSFVFLCLLIFLYNPVRHSMKKALISAEVSFLIVLFFYMVFEILMNISFV